MTHTLDPLTRFSDMLRQALGDLLDPLATDFLSMMAPESIMEFPFAPPGYVQEIKGRAQLAPYLAQLGSILAIDQISTPTVHFTHNPAIVILEFTCKGHGLQTDRPYHQRYISVLTLQNGLIVRYQDYWNPLVALTALGGNEALNLAMGAHS